MSDIPIVRVVPSHGSRTAAISWTMPVGRDNHEVFVYYSPNGLKGSWELLNESTPVVGPTYWVDPDFVQRNKTTRGYYRVAIVSPRNEIVDSHPAGIFDALTREEHRMLRIKIREEVREARTTNGLPMWHCVPRVGGELSGGIDPDSGQTLGIECPDVDPEDASYGQRYKGGFYTPVLTWVRARAAKAGEVKDRPDNLGADDAQRLQCRYLPFPELRPEHMFVDPQTDNRYAVSENVSTFLLRGVAPLAWEGEMVLLPRSDARYRFPVPPFDGEQFKASRGPYAGPYQGSYNIVQ